MVTRNQKYTFASFVDALKPLAEVLSKSVELLADKKDASAAATTVQDTARNLAATAVAIGMLAGMKKSLIIAAAQDELPDTPRRAASISDAIAVLTNPEEDEERSTEIAEGWAARDFVNFPVRPLLMALRPAPDFRRRIAGIFLSAWKATPDAETLSHTVQSGIELGMGAIEQANGAYLKAEGEEGDRRQEAVKAAQRWVAVQVKPQEEEEAQAEAPKQTQGKRQTVAA